MIKKKKRWMSYRTRGAFQRISRELAWCDAEDSSEIDAETFHDAVHSFAEYQVEQAPEVTEECQKHPVMKQLCIQWDFWPFTVDRFQSAFLDGSSWAFLTHSHRDHMVGLQEHLASTITLFTHEANREEPHVQHQPRVRFLQPSDYDQWITLDTRWSFATWPAGHTSDSLMFLFRCDQQFYILFTGDWKRTAADHSTNHWNDTWQTRWATLKVPHIHMLFYDDTLIDCPVIHNAASLLELESLQARHPELVVRTTRTGLETELKCRSADPTLHAACERGGVTSGPTYTLEKASGSIVENPNQHVVWLSAAPHVKEAKPRRQARNLHRIPLALHATAADHAALCAVLPRDLRWTFVAIPASGNTHAICRPAVPRQRETERGTS
jgi:hypothetical protein